MDFLHLSFLSCNCILCFQGKITVENLSKFPWIWCYILHKISENIIMQSKKHKVLNVSLFYFENNYLVASKNHWNATVF